MVATVIPFNPDTTRQAEYGFFIDDINGTYTTSIIYTLSTIGGSLATTSNTDFTLHTHPWGGIMSPSAADFFNLGNLPLNFKTAYVVAADGTKYAITINNRTLLDAFIVDNPGAVLPVSADFTPSSNLSDMFLGLRADIAQSGMTNAEAEERALGELMRRAGVTLSKADFGSDVFKKIGVQPKLNPDGTTVTYDFNGNDFPIYTKSDCK